MAGFPLSFLTDRIFRTNTDENGNLFGAKNTDKALLELVDNLSNGETIIGRVLSVSKDSFRILTNQNVTINAKAEGNILLKEGTSVLFEVSKGQGGRVSLRPLYQNTNERNTATEALRQAGLPVNGRTLELIARRMEYGEQIDRNALLDAYKDVALFEDAPVKYIVDLQKMDIPVNEINLEQYESYMNMENAVSESFETVSGEITDELNGLVELALSDLSESEDLLQASNAYSRLFSLTEGLKEFADSLEATDTPSLDYSKEDIDALVNVLKESGMETSETEKLYDESEHPLRPATVLKSLLTDLEGMLETVERAKEPSEIIPRESIKSFINTDEFRNAFVKSFASQWSLEKSKITDKKEIKALYERISDETVKLAARLNETLPKDSPAVSNLTNLSHNMDFMQALNNYVPYVQLPFHSEGDNHTSELYVFKNKHPLGSENGELSAFIHLDMKNLGPTDVFVKMQNTNISTHFTLKDEATLRFIESNLHYLDKRLNDKGYNMNSKASVSEDCSSPIEKMIDSTTSRLMISRNSFDARV